MSKISIIRRNGFLVCEYLFSLVILLIINSILMMPVAGIIKTLMDIGN